MNNTIESHLNALDYFTNELYSAIFGVELKFL